MEKGIKQWATCIKLKKKNSMCRYKKRDKWSYYTEKMKSKAYSLQSDKNVCPLSHTHRNIHTQKHALYAVMAQCPHVLLWGIMGQHVCPCFLELCANFSSQNFVQIHQRNLHMAPLLGWFLWTDWVLFRVAFLFVLTFFLLLRIGPLRPFFVFLMKAKYLPSFRWWQSHESDLLVQSVPSCCSWHRSFDFFVCVWFNLLTSLFISSVTLSLGWDNSNKIKVYPKYLGLSTWILFCHWVGRLFEFLFHPSLCCLPVCALGPLSTLVILVSLVFLLVLPQLHFLLYSNDYYSLCICMCLVAPNIICHCSSC